MLTITVIFYHKKTLATYIYVQNYIIGIFRINNAVALSALLGADSMSAAAIDCLGFSSGKYANGKTSGVDLNVLQIKKQAADACQLQLSHTTKTYSLTSLLTLAIR